VLAAGERLLRLKSWNERADCNMMEPDQRHGNGLLDFTRSAW
jgi:hypothetical protein